VRVDGVVKRRKKTEEGERPDAHNFKKKTKKGQEIEKKTEKSIFEGRSPIKGEKGKRNDHLKITKVGRGGEKN